MTARPLKLLAAAALALLPLVFVALLAVDAGAAPGGTRLVGTYVPFHVDTRDPRAFEETHFLQTADGVVELDLSGVRAPQPGARVVVDGTPSASGLDVNGIRTVAAAQAAPSTGTVNGLVITVRWGTSVPTATPTQAASFVFGAQATSTASWLREASFGKLTLQGTATPVLTIADPGSCPSTTALSDKHAFLDLLGDRAEAAAAAAGYSTANYPVRIINAPLPYICGARGWGGPTGRTWIANGLANASVLYERFIVAHEVGHNFGLNHSHGVECGLAAVSTTCLGSASSNVEYGDPWDTMGSNGSGLPLYNARQLARIGWLPRVAQTVTTSGTYTISPLESTNPTYATALNVNTSRLSYTFEFRQPLGVDAFMSEVSPNPTGGVLVHVRNVLPGADTGSLLVDTTPGSLATGDFYDSALASGRTFTDLDNAFTLKVVSVGSGGATVQLTFAGSTVDTTSPVMSSVSLSFARGNQATGTTVPVTFSWSATDAVGVTAYEVEWSGNGGATWVKDTGVAATATSMTRSLPLGTQHRYRVRARDAAGNWSGHSYSTAVTPGLTDDKAYTLAGAWGRYNLGDTIGGTYSAADKSGSWFQFAFTGRAAALVAPKFSNAGRATIYCDNAPLETIDLQSSSTNVRQVVSACHFAQAGQHTLKVVVEGTSTRPWVGVDAFAALS